MQGNQPHRPLLEMPAQLGRKPVPPRRLRARLRGEDHRRQERPDLRGDGPLGRGRAEPSAGDPPPRRDPKGAAVDRVPAQNADRAEAGADHAEPQDDRRARDEGGDRVRGGDHDTIRAERDHPWGEDT